MFFSDEKLNVNTKKIIRFLTMLFGFCLPILLRSSLYLKPALFLSVLLASLFKTEKKQMHRTTHLISQTYVDFLFIGTAAATMSYIFVELTKEFLTKTQ